MCITKCAWTQLNRKEPLEGIYFDQYKMIRMAAVPEIEIDLVSSQASPEGLGEISLPPVAAALCNAIYRATGKRIRKLPIIENELEIEI